MNNERAHSPVIFLLDGKAKRDNGSIKRWLEKSRFQTCEAADIIDLIEEMSDFTVRDRADVFLLEVDPKLDNYVMIKQFVESAEDEFPIFALDGGVRLPEQSDCFVGSLQQVTAELNRMIPAVPKSQAAATSM